MTKLLRILARCSPGDELVTKIEGWRSDGFHVRLFEEAGDPAAFEDALPTADIILKGRGTITADTIRRAPKLKLIQQIGVGVDLIDLKAAEEAHIAVCNMPGTNSAAVAELTI